MRETNYSITRMLLSIALFIMINGLSYADELLVIERGSDSIIKVDEETGNKSLFIKGFNKPNTILLDQANDCLWLFDSGNNQVVKISHQGEELLRISGFKNPMHGAIDKDGKLWIAGGENGKIVKVSPKEGREIFHIKGFFSNAHDLVINPNDGSVWVSDIVQSRVVVLSSRGKRLGKIEGYGLPIHIAINSKENVAWVTYKDYGVLKISAQGLNVLADLGGMIQPSGISIDERDGTCWVSDIASGEILHVSSDGRKIIKRIKGFNQSRGISEINADGTFWVADWANNRIVKLSSQGKRLKVIKGISFPLEVTVVGVR